MFQNKAALRQSTKTNFKENKLLIKMVLINMVLDNDKFWNEQKYKNLIILVYIFENKIWMFFFVFLLLLKRNEVLSR